MCYWRAQERVKELSDEDVIHFFQDRKKEGKVLAVLVGGEPYVRRDLLPKLTPILPASWVVTSGTTPLLSLPNTTHFVSIDGGNAETHDRVRRMPGLYNRIVKNISDARKKGKFQCYIHSVLNKANFTQAYEIISTWHKNGLADGIVFSTMTPIREGGEDQLQLSENDRIWIIQELQRLKMFYGPFLLMTENMINRFHPDHTKMQTPETCGTARFVGSYDAAGERIAQCILSDKADCTSCGCYVTPFIDTLIEYDWKTILLGLKLVPNQ